MCTGLEIAALVGTGVSAASTIDTAQQTRKARRNAPKPRQEAQAAVSPFRVDKSRRRVEGSAGVNPVALLNTGSPTLLGE